jgi:hypothetical protein
MTNYGRIAARQVATTLEWEISELEISVSPPTYLQPPFGDIAPGATKTMRVQANRRFAGGRGNGLQQGFKNPRNKLLVYGALTYMDTLSGESRRQPWCFVFDGKGQDDSLNMRRCEYSDQ